MSRASTTRARDTRNSAYAPRESSYVDDGLWLELMATRWEAWARRSRDEDLTEPQRAYAARRARALGRPYSDRLRECARAGVVVKCQCPGKRDVRWYTCRQHLVCKLCRKQRSRKYRAKIYAALEARLAEAPSSAHLVMVTMTLRPSGDIARDRKRLADSWRRYYKANRKRWGAFAYVGVHELHKSGTPHLHVVCVWPVGAPGDGTQGDWKLQRELWVQSCQWSERVSFSASRNTGRVARYVSKYVAKGVQTDDYTPELRARVLAATYNTRWVLTSRGAWVPFLPCCTACGSRIVKARFRFPDAPAYTMADRLRLAGWSTRSGCPPDDSDRGTSQTAFAFPDPVERGGSRCP